MLLAEREQARDLEYQTARSQDEEWRLSAESAARFVNSPVYIDEPQGAARRSPPSPGAQSHGGRRRPTLRHLDGQRREGFFHTLWKNAEASLNHFATLFLSWRPRPDRDD